MRTFIFIIFCYTLFGHIYYIYRLVQNIYKVADVFLQCSARSAPRGRKLPRSFPQRFRAARTKKVRELEAPALEESHVPAKGDQCSLRLGLVQYELNTEKLEK